ncbi:MAG: 23S rRNA (pseudouridine(1915)-N(3))-methyltransferase RlmH [Flavobacteriales bacterium]|nr:23S rRNA (pseudouridine(1915)-N(3))-methyltransferase RlmH [Flavobacteriales bacterium]
MKIKLLVIGKTDEDWLKKGIEKYIQRLKHYVSFEFVEIPEIKNSAKMAVNKRMDSEADELLKHIRSNDVLIALDEHGTEYNSVNFAGFIENKMIEGNKQLTFIVGGPFGIAKKIADSCHVKLSLSQLTFSHQMVRLFFVEQIYRAFTIIKGEKYHHE